MVNIDLGVRHATNKHILFIILKKCGSDHDHFDRFVNGRSNVYIDEILGLLRT